MTAKALLFINGVPPEQLPDPKEYDLIACSDGAFHYLREKGFPLEKLDFISGDFDSCEGHEKGIDARRFIYTPDQDKTDFRKALEILVGRNVKTVDVYGGSGGEMDHFLGNLTVAFQLKDTLDITFFDEYARYFFSPNYLVLNKVKNKLISLYPFPEAKNVTTTGLNWPLTNGCLSITGDIGTRNIAIDDTVTISFDEGNLVVFVGH